MGTDSAHRAACGEMAYGNDNGIGLFSDDNTPLNVGSESAPFLTSSRVFVARRFFAG
jgi:hypothetical protein